MLIEPRLTVSAGSDLPFTMTWTPDDGYALSTETPPVVTTTGGTLGTGAHAPATVGNVTTFYLSAAAPVRASVQFVVTLVPYAVVTLEAEIRFE
jgi:hypothetical protein